MMIKVGRVVPCYQQLCYAHGIQLAVIDVLYQKNSKQNSSEETQIQFNMTDDEGGLSVTLSLPSVEVVLNYKDLIAKVRKAVNIFKKSPTKK